MIREGAKIMDWQVTHHMNYWGGNKLAYPDVPKEHPRFAKCMVVGNLVFVSGCAGRDPESDAPTPENIAAQVNQALELARGALDSRSFMLPPHGSSQSSRSSSHQWCSPYEST